LELLVRPGKHVSSASNRLDAAAWIVVHIQLASKAADEHIEPTVQWMISTLEDEFCEMFAR
jgi:hypothetical protein